jgi:hypothetical protein
MVSSSVSTGYAVASIVSSVSLISEESVGVPEVHPEISKMPINRLIPKMIILLYFVNIATPFLIN